MQGGVCGGDIHKTTCRQGWGGEFLGIEGNDFLRDVQGVKPSRSSGDPF